MTKIGRPLLPPTKRRSEFLNTRLSGLEMELIEAAAVIEDKNPATWSREVLIDRARSSVRARASLPPIPATLEQPMHLIPTLPRKSGRDQIEEASKNLLQNLIGWRDRPVADGQIYQAAISVMTRNAQLWPWPVSNEDSLYFDADGNGTIKQAAVLFLAEAMRLENCNAGASEGECYVHKKLFDRIYQRSLVIRDLVDHLGEMLDATQTGVFVDPSLKYPTK